MKACWSVFMALSALGVQDRDLGLFLRRLVSGEVTEL